MDTEPWRCRRTDGKKWRCREAILPDQKYCERHVHRGCLRSRKPVELNKTVSTSNSTTTSSLSSLKATPNLQSAMKSNARNNNKLCIKNQGFKIKKCTMENARAPLDFSFSRKSVLQHGNVRNCGTSSNNQNSGLAIAESVRCRRTDGKKWQCSKGVIPEQKYCAQHMHRGAKKVKNCERLKNGLSFSVGASYQLGASYQRTGDDGNRSNESSSSSDDNEGSDSNDATNSTSSSSDATTISM